MQKTEKLGLNLFEGTDPVLAENFNENTNLLEAAISKKATICCGSWEGDNSDNTYLHFENRPYLVLIWAKYGVFFCFRDRDMCVSLEFPSYVVNQRPIVWSEEGCTLTLPDRLAFSRLDDKTYQYIAFLEN